MVRYLAPLFCSVLLLAGWTATEANAQAAKAQLHVAAARAAAYEPGHDFTPIFALCAEPNPNPPAAAPAAAPAAPAAKPTIPPRSQWYIEPQKVFDNLYHIGAAAPDNEAIWAVTTTEGIILINAGHDYSAEELIVNGLKKMGLDPAQIKYVILTESEPDSSGGTKLIQDRYKARVLLSEADWDVMARSTVPAAIKPRKDMIVTDGQKLTLGDVTVTLYVTPGNSPGTVSMLISPLKDGNQRHVAAIFGGRGAGGSRPANGVQYFKTDIDGIRAQSASAKRFKAIAESAGADVFLSLHHSWDRVLDKLNALKFRKPGGPHTLVSKSAVSRFQTVISECMDAQLAWREGK
jgi:metallo-beta-lactamase class B